MRLLSVFAFAVWCSVGCLLASGLLLGCGEEPPLAPATAEGAAIRTEMRAADLAGIDRAFSRLARVPHRETVRIEQLDAAGRVVAFREHTLGRPSPRLLGADSAGRFDYGAFGRFAGEHAVRLDSARSPLRWMLARGETGYEPAYLTERARDAYAYERLGSDTGNGFQATAEIGEGDEQTIRLVRYHLAASGALQQLVLERENAATLFDEQTRLEVALSVDPEALPVRVVTDSRVTAPFSETRRFRLTRTFAPLRPGER